MIRTGRLRAQHAELRIVVAKLLGIINSEIVADSAKQARALLSELAGKLLVHLAMEWSSMHIQPASHWSERHSQKSTIHWSDTFSPSEPNRQFLMYSTSSGNVGIPSGPTVTLIASSLDTVIYRQYLDSWP